MCKPLAPLVTLQNVAQTSTQSIQQATQAYDRGDWPEAERICVQLLEFRPPDCEVLNLLGNMAAQTGRAQKAVAFLSQAIAVDPSRADLRNNLGIALQDLARVDEALESYDRAIAIEPDFTEAYVNRGNALADSARYDAALASYDRAIALNAGIADAYISRGNALSALKRDEEALESYERAIALAPEYGEAYFNRGQSLLDLNRPEVALESFGRAMKLRPDYPDLFGLWLYTKMTICDWRNFEADCSSLIEKIEREENASPPFPVFAISDSASLQRKASELWVRARHLSGNVMPDMAVHPRRDRIRLGYYSADFHDHATSRLMAELFERHDKSRFELTAFSFGPDRKDEMRQRVAVAFDTFIEARGQSDKAVAILSRDMGIDIALDLKGFSQDSRAGVFAQRAAPIQVNYLGYPGTMGAGFMDYLIADATLVPDDHRQHYSEKIAYLPHSYQPNDTKRAISDKAIMREEMGLPLSGIVYCCFNNNFKIAPGMFDQWMRILSQVEGSVLWLLEDNARAASNLRQEAWRRGIEASRLVFAKRAPLAEHLVRHRLADLFLDTLPCNAHTTASDALWAGLPVLTCMGESFPGRVAASLLNGIQLPELIAESPQAYVRHAIALGRNPNELAALKQRLAENRLSAPLFDIGLYTRHLEAALTTMYESYQAKEPPDHIYVSDLSGVGR